MTLGQLNLTFSETVKGSDSFAANQVTLQSASNGSEAGVQSYTLTLQEASISTNDRIFYAVQIGTADLDAIKELTQLVLDRSNTYLSLTALTITDMNDNAISAVESTSAMQVTGFTADTIDPVFVQADLDLRLNLDNLTLYFDETVRASSLRIDHITIHNAANTSSVTLSNSVGTTPDGTVLVVLLSHFDRNSLKVLADLAVDASSTVVRLAAGAVQDMALVPNAVATTTVQVAAAGYEADATVPELVGFAADVDAGILYLDFNEPVKAASVQPTRLTVQAVADLTSSAAPADDSFSLRGGNVLTPDGLQVQINLTTADLNEIKRLFQVLTTNATTHVSAAAGLVTDMALVGNSLAAVPTSQGFPGLLIADTTRPRLLSFNLNMTTEVLSLTFDETVNASSLDVTALSLQKSASVVAAADQLALTDAQLDRSADSTELHLTLVLADLNELKRLGVAASAATTWLALADGGVADMNSQPVHAHLNSANALQVTSFGPDLTAPQLVHFNLTLDGASPAVTLFFSETVRSSTLQVDQLTLVTASDGSGNSHTLQLTSTSSSASGTVLVVDLGRPDFDAITALYPLASSAATTFLVAPAASVSDMALAPNTNALAPVLASAPQPVLGYTGDALSPGMDRFCLDMDRGVLQISWSETVNASSLAVVELTLHNPSNDSSTTSVAVQGAVSATTGLVGVVDITLLQPDLNLLKAATGLATSQGDTFLTATAATVTDVAGNALAPVSGQGEGACHVVDSTSPTLQSAVLDLTAETLFLHFSETVDTASVHLPAITVHPVGGSSVSPASVTLTAARNVVRQLTNLTITLSVADLNAIKLQTDLATNASNTHVELNPSTSGGGSTPAVLDMNGNAVTTVRTAAALVADSTAPQLTSFSLDMSTGQLGLVFNEVVLASSFDATGLSLYSGAADVSGCNGACSTAFPSNTTLETVCQTSCASPVFPTSFCVVQCALVVPTAGAGRTACESGCQARPADSDAAHAVALGAQSVLVAGAGDSTQLTVQLSPADLNELRLRPLLAVDNTSSLLTILHVAAADMNFNAVQFTGNNVLVASPFVGDTVRPTVVAFDLDLTSLQLLVVFDEAMSLVTNASTLSVQDGTGSHQVTLTQLSSAQRSLNGTVLLYNLTVADANLIKLNVALAVSAGTTVLGVQAEAFTDLSGNAVVPVQQSVRTFVPDTVSPELQRFDLNLTSERLTLYFSETVLASSLAPPTLTLHQLGGAPPSASGETLTLSVNNTVETGDGAVQTVGLSKADVDALKLLQSLATQQNDTFLTATAATVQDMTGNNSLVPIVALPVTVYGADVVAPVVVNFNLSLTTELLTLFLSEPVDAQSLDVASIALVNLASGPVQQQVQLTSGSQQLLSVDGDVVQFQLGLADLNNLKQLTNLAVSSTTTFLMVGPGPALVDLANNRVADTVPASTGLPVNDFAEDTVLPVLQAFALDMNTGLAVFNFSETMLAASLQPTAFSFSNSAAPGSLPTQQFNVTSAATVSGAPDASTLQFTLSASDLFRLRELDICQSAATCYLQHTAGAVQDMRPNDIAARSYTVAESLPASLVAPDTVQPILTSFELDLNNGTLLLSFDEPVRTSVLDPTQIVLQDFFSATHVYRLTGGTTDGVSSPTVLLHLNQADFHALRATDLLVTGRFNTWITVTAQTISDTAFGANALVAINDTNQLTHGMAASQFAPDATLPILEAFALDLSTAQATLQLNFSEPIRIAPATSVLLPSFTLVEASAAGSSSSSGSNVTLSTASQVQTTDNAFSLLVYLATADSDAIKSLDTLGTSVNNTFLSVLAGAVTDTTNNALAAVVPALQVSQVLIDATPPTLLSYTLDMNTGVLVLSFSETVRRNTLQSDQISLFDAGLGVSHTLASASVLSQLTTGRQENGSLVVDPALPLGTHTDTVSLTLDGTDLNALKALGIGLSDTQLGLTLGSSAIQDMAGTNGTSVPQSSNFGPSSFVQDTTAPRLLFFYADLSLGTLELHFSETVRAASLNVTNLAVTNGLPALHSSFEGVPLTGVAQATTSNGAVQVLTLLDSDLNEIKRLRGLAFSGGSTALVFPEPLYHDQNDNAVELVPEYIVVTAAVYQADNVAPVLLSFVLDVNAGHLNLTFSETVQASTVATAQLTLQAADGAAAPQLTLTTAASTVVDAHTASAPFGSTQTDSTILSIALGAADLNLLKFDETLAFDFGSTRLSLTNTTVTDMNNNAVTAVPVSSALALAAYTADATQPQLQTYDLNLVTGNLTMYFDEPVKFGAAAGLTFGGTSNYTLTDSTGAVREQVGTVLVLPLSATDLSALQGALLATSAADTVLSVRGTAVADTALAANAVVLVEQAPVRNYTYYAAPTIEAVEPVFGQDTGGTLVTVRGRNFVQAALRATSGGGGGGTPLPVTLYVSNVTAPAPAAHVTILNDTHLTFETPPHSGVVGVPVLVQVELDNSRALVATLPAAFTYLGTPVILGVSPGALTLQGGTVVTVQGQNLGPATGSGTVGPVVAVNLVAGNTTVGCSPVTVTTINATLDELTCTVQPLTGADASTLDVVVTVDNTTVTVLGAAQVLNTPEVTSIAPGIGYEFAATVITVTGRNFGLATGSNGPTVAVRLLDNNTDTTLASSGITSYPVTCQNLVVLNDTTLQCTLPPHVGVGVLQVEVDGISSSAAAATIVAGTAAFVSFQNTTAVGMADAQLNVLETATSVTVRLVRSQTTAFPAPLHVNVSTSDGQATQPTYYTSHAETVYFGDRQYETSFTFNITASSRTQVGPRKGVEDDAAFTVSIDSAVADFGPASIDSLAPSTSIVVRAICLSITNGCEADITSAGVVYKRLDGLDNL